MTKKNILTKILIVFFINFAASSVIQLQMTSFSNIANAQSSHDESTIDSATKEALQKTQELLVNPSERNKAIKDDANAKKADAYTKSVGGDNAEKIYGLASKVFEKLVIKYNGDTQKIQKVLDKAARDPSGFANSEFTTEELKALSELAAKIPPINGKK